MRETVQVYYMIYYYKIKTSFA